MVDPFRIENFPTKPVDQRIWVVRAQSGEFVNHFTENSVIAIAHLDEMNVSESLGYPLILDLDYVYSYLMKGKSNNRSRLSKYRQIIYFYQILKIGDLVITLDSKNVAIGRIVGNAKYSKTPLRHFNEKINEYERDMKMGLRRSVKWAATFKRSSLPYGLAKSLQARQTIFSLDKHWKAVYHTIYPTFYSEEGLHFSLHLGKRSKISSYAIEQLLSCFSSLELASDGDSIGESTKLEDLEKTKETANLTLSLKAQFTSPGDIWTILAEVSKFPQYYLLYSALFGSKLLGWDGIVDRDMRHVLIKPVFAALATKFSGLVKNLDISIPRFNTNILETTANDEPKISSSLEKLEALKSVNIVETRQKRLRPKNLDS